MATKRVKSDSSVDLADVARRLMETTREQGPGAPWYEIFKTSVDGEDVDVSAVLTNELNDYVNALKQEIKALTLAAAGAAQDTTDQ